MTHILKQGLCTYKFFLTLDSKDTGQVEEWETWQLTQTLFFLTPGIIPRVRNLGVLTLRGPKVGGRILKNSGDQMKQQYFIIP